MPNEAQFNSAFAEAQTDIMLMHTCFKDSELRRKNAAEHGQQLAMSVLDYLTDPTGLGYNYLEKANNVYLAASSGGFTLSVEETIKCIEDLLKSTV